ncbi:MAG: sel1 repeat family protein [Gammaproteobacteria bacterium]|nr:sel1 repeat family protein [Gammaproteobacteria bacterium]
MNASMYYLIATLLWLPSLSSAAEPDYIEQGKQGIEAFRVGNLIQAMDLLGKSAEKGYAPAQATLAYILDKSEEDDAAFKLFQQAAEQGYAEGQFGLGNMYAKGEGTAVDTIKAGELIHQSAVQNYMPAVRAYARALEYGTLGFTQNPQQAEVQYQRCHAAGDSVCSQRLAQAYKNGELGLAVDINRSTQLTLQLNQKTEEKQNAKK